MLLDFLGATIRAHPWWAITIVVVVLFLTMQYWLGPILIRFTQRVPAKPAFVPFDESRHPIPADVAAALRETVAALAGEGFTVAADLFRPGSANDATTRAVLLDHPATGEQALVAALHLSTNVLTQKLCYVEVLNKFADGRSMSVMNSPQLRVFAPVAAKVVEQLPDVRDPVRVLEVSRALMRRDYDKARRARVNYRGDPARYLSEAMVRELTQQIQTGYLWLDESAAVFRPTWKGALLMTYKLLWPIKQRRARRLRLRAASLLRKLGLDGPERNPIAVPPAESLAGA